MCNGGAPREAQFCIYRSPLASKSVTRVEWVPARGWAFSMPCQSLAVLGPVMIWKWLPSYCASQAHMWISLLNTKSICLLSLLVLVNQTLCREQALWFPTMQIYFGEPKRGQHIKLGSLLDTREAKFNHVFLSLNSQTSVLSKLGAQATNL